MCVQVRDDAVAAIAAEFRFNAPRLCSGAFAELTSRTQMRGAQQHLAMTGHGIETNCHEIGAPRLDTDGA